MRPEAIVPVENIVRIHGRGLFLSLLEKEMLLTKIRILSTGRFVPETKNWDEYWKPLNEFDSNEIDDKLHSLHIAWSVFIQSDFNSSLRQEFCFRYFSLLDRFLSIDLELGTTQPWLNALHTILGFECFGLTSSASDSQVFGAGTNTMRNPCYLLAKLKMPDTPDDPQYLPIVTVAGTSKPELFYHYRQYTLSTDSPISLLLYPAVSKEKHSESFRLINTLASNIRYAADPWTSERAEILFQGVVQKILQTIKSIGGSVSPLEFVDIGAGSGSLVAKLCQHVQKSGSYTELNIQFRLWFVDLEPSDPSRFIHTKKISSSVDSLIYLGDDYRNWLSRPQPLPPTNGLRIALISKLLDVFSRFSIQCFSAEDQSPDLRKSFIPSELELYSPSICLASRGIGTKGLSISNSQRIISGGKVYAQASLSNYYRGLLQLSTPVDLANTSIKGSFLPVRTFDPECLVTWNGESVISRLAENCNYLIIEDGDLNPQALVDHATKFSLRGITVFDMTKTLKLKGNYLYLIGKKKAMPPSLSGEQIW